MELPATHSPLNAGLHLQQKKMQVANISNIFAKNYT